MNSQEWERGLFLSFCFFIYCCFDVILFLAFRIYNGVALPEDLEATAITQAQSPDAESPSQHSCVNQLQGVMDDPSVTRQENQTSPTPSEWLQTSQTYPQSQYKGEKCSPLLETPSPTQLVERDETYLPIGQSVSSESDPDAPPWLGGKPERPPKHTTQSPSSQHSCYITPTQVIPQTPTQLRSQTPTQLLPQTPTQLRSHTPTQILPPTPTLPVTSTDSTLSPPLSFCLDLSSDPSSEDTEHEASKIPLPRSRGSSRFRSRSVSRTPSPLAPDTASVLRRISFSPPSQSSSTYLESFPSSTPPPSLLLDSQNSVLSFESNNHSDKTTVGIGNKKRVSLGMSALNSLSQDELESLLSQPLERSESTLRKEAWVEGLYKPFCQRAGIAPYPLKPTVVRGFLSFLALKAGYALSGIAQIVVPALRHRNIDEGGTDEPAVLQSIKQALRMLNTNPRVKKKGRGKEPLCSFDVKELVSRIPLNYPSRYLDASLFLFALHTGSRALTCEGIRIGDIEAVEVDRTLGSTYVVILQRITKGSKNWDHPVCIEGYLDKEDPLDAVYYLNKHLESYIGKGLIALGDKNEASPYDSRQLWPLSKDAMRERIKIRLKQAGFPDTSRWAFHSLRSGHICSCLMAAGADPGRRASVLETTAVVAGWRPYGKAQMGYIKKVAERLIVSSRLLGLGSGLNKGVMSPPAELHNQLTHSDRTTTTHLIAAAASSPSVASTGYVRVVDNSEQFHNIKLLTPNFGLKPLLDEVRKLFGERFDLNDVDRHRCEEYKHICYKNILVLWGKREAGNTKVETTSEWEVYRKRGHDIVVRKLTAGISPKEIVEDLMKDFPDISKSLTTVPDKKPRRHPRDSSSSSAPSRETIVGSTGKKSRRRIAWREWEDNILKNAKQDGVPFSKILKSLPDRLLGDCYDRWKYLVKHQLL